LTIYLDNKKSYYFVIIGTIDSCESKDDAFDFLQEYLSKDKNKIPDINTIHLFGNPNKSSNL
jgi:hypothetical protein